MGNATNVLEAALGDALLLGQAFPVITALQVCLYSSAPNKAGMGGTELSGNGYAPVNCNPGAGHWIKDAAQEASDHTVYRTTVAVTFPVATGSDWPTISHFGLKNQIGQLLFIAPLTVAKSIANGQQAVFLAGELEIAIG
jgi:hypothetical protein